MRAMAVSTRPPNTPFKLQCRQNVLKDAILSPHRPIHPLRSASGTRRCRRRTFVERCMPDPSSLEQSPYATRVHMGVCWYLDKQTRELWLVLVLLAHHMAIGLHA